MTITTGYDIGNGENCDLFSNLSSAAFRPEWKKLFAVYLKNIDKFISDILIFQIYIFAVYMMVRMIMVITTTSAKMMMTQPVPEDILPAGHPTGPLPVFRTPDHRSENMRMTIGKYDFSQ